MKPCAKAHSVPAPGCRLCWLAEHDARYQQLWGLPVTAGRRATPQPQPSPARPTSPPPLAPHGRALPCIHEEHTIEYCKTCSGKPAEGRHVRSCALHDRCTRDRVGPAVRACVDCVDYVPDAPLPHHPEDSSPEVLAHAAWIAAHRPRPRVDHHDAREIAAYRVLLREAVARAAASPYPEGRYAGRGITMPAGGWCRLYGQPQPYFWQAMAATYTLRRRGCLLPVQFWFLAGELEPWMVPLAARVGAECVDAQAAGIQPDMRCPGGWQLKIHAMLAAPWREVIHLDADNIVALDPAELFDDPAYVAKGALLWADNPGHPAGHLKQRRAHPNDGWDRHWERLGEPDRGWERNSETAQIVVDKARCWAALQVVRHFADHAEYWGGFNGGSPGVWYGDTGDFHAAFLVTRTPYHLFPGWEWHTGGFYRHRDSAGRLVFQHACHRKGHLVNGHAVDGLSGSDAIAEAARFARAPVPWADGSPAEADRLINPERHFRLAGGDGGQCRTVWLDVVARNEYRLPDSFAPGDMIIDVGGNVGAFAYAAARRGAGRVLSYEPFPGSAAKARHNLELLPACVVYPAAVWRSDLPAGSVPLHPHQGLAFTGGYSTVLPPSDPGWTVPAVPLDELLRGLGRVRLLKVDCEGGEYPILYTSRGLGRVTEIVGEYHHGALPELAGVRPVGGWPQPWTAEGLVRYLAGEGFAVTTEAASPTHGLFWARRQQQPPI